VIETAAGALGRNLVPFGATALVASLPNLILSYLVPGDSATRFDDSGSLAALFLQLAVTLLVSQIVTVTLVYGTLQTLRGRQVTVGDCLSTGFGHFGAALGVALLSGVAVLAASMLFLVPGIILSVVWAVAIPAATIENAGVTGALGRSADLTRDRRWRVFGVLIVAHFLTIAAAWVLGLVVGVLKGLDLQAFTIVDWVINTFTDAFGACVVATLYYYLRRDKEGADINQIASVFD